MPVRTFYFDESGYTGYNLLDPHQPIFVISSVDVDEEVATEILKHSFPLYNGEEYKFGNIWSRKHRSGLLKFSEQLTNLSNTSFTYIIDKKFAVLTKIIDHLVEPVAHKIGYDFYADGYCWKYCNYVHFGLTNYAPAALLDTLLATYQNFSRAPSRTSLAAMQSKLRLMANSSEEPVKLFLEQMADGAEYFEYFSDVDSFKSSNELHTSTMIAIISHWRQRFSEDFAVVHDASSTFLRNRQMWESVTNPSVPEHLHPMGDGSATPFPLRVISTESVDSKDYIQVQFCDVLAGLCARFFSTDSSHPDRPFLEELVDAGLSSHSYSGVFPRPEFPENMTPKKLSGPDVVDQMTGIISGSQKKRS